MSPRRSRNGRPTWLLPALGSLLGGVIWWAARTISRRRLADRRETALAGPAALRAPITMPAGGRSTALLDQVRGASVYDFPPAQTAPAPAERGSFPWLLASALVLILVGFTVFSLLGDRQNRPQVVTVPGGDVEAGRRIIQAWGCGSCHSIPGVPGANGKVGPKLEQMAEQTYIAGMLPNTPDNLIRWIMNPQEIQPGNAMPNTGVNAETARHMAAYLYSIRK